MDNKQTHFDEKLSKLHADYLCKLRDIADTLNEYCLKLPQSITEEILHHIHGLAGSATIFGYPDLCRQAQKLDQYLSKNPILSPEILKELKGLSIHCKNIAEDNKAFDPHKEHSPTKDNEKLKILLVEDDPFQQMIIQDLIESQGHTIHTAENGKTALTILEHNCFDFILCDCMMPIMNGYEFSQKLREKEKNLPKQHIILALTGNIHANEIKQCKTSGMNGFVRKDQIETKLLPTIKKYTCTPERNN